MGKKRRRHKPFFPSDITFSIKEGDIRIHKGRVSSKKQFLDEFLGIGKKIFGMDIDDLIEETKKMVREKKNGKGGL